MPPRANAPLSAAMIVLALAACPRRQETPPVVADGASCPEFDDPAVIGQAPAEHREISGVVASRRYPGVLWVHNDSGAGPLLHALGEGGAELAQVEVVGAEAIDWEDIAIGPEPEAGRDSLYIADFGDNRRQRAEVVIYRIPEPELGAEAGQRLRSAPAEARTLHYDHAPENAEALLVDPKDGALYIITKRPGEAVLHKVVGDTIERLGPVDTGVGALVTGAEFSREGGWIAVRTYNAAYLWPRPPAKSVLEALAEPPCPIKIAREPQGEAIAFTADGAAIVTISEGHADGDGTVPIHRLSFKSGPIEAAASPAAPE